jgi:hypothetical protein
LELGQLSIAKLRKLFQIQGSEKCSSRKPKNDPASFDNKRAGKSKEDAKGHGRNAADAYQGAAIVDVDHPELNPGDTCLAEACDGRLYEMSEPGTFVQVTGAPLARATRYTMQKLRCAICEIIYTAPLPSGVSNKKYDANFIAMLMINKCFCLIHARRQFYELPNGYDDLADKVIGLIGTIYDHEAHTKGYSPEKRLAYHQEKSIPVMAQLKAYLEEQTLEFEPNSIPGKAIGYILNRWTQLSQFLRQVHAPLDTNIVERALKLVIQVRKSSMFYKTLSSAAFASYVQSALYSAAQNELNPCDYMCALIENEQAVIQNPNAWLPWRYKKTLKQSLEALARQDSLPPVVLD